jgi:hypothetical protein
MAKQTPIPQNPIGESFVWRDWFQRLSDRVFGSAASLDVPIQPEYGGTGITTYNKGDIIYSNATDNLTRLPAPSVTSILQMTALGVPSWTTASTGTVTSVGGTGTVNGLTLTGTVTSSGNLTLGGTLNLSSPPAIGGTTPAAGTFTTLTANTTNIQNTGANSGLTMLRNSDSANNSTRIFLDASGGVASIYNNANTIRFQTGATIGTSSGALQFNVTHTASAVNYVQVTGAATAGSPVISSQGSDTNVGLRISSKGSFNISFWSNNNTNQQFAINGAAASVNRLEVAGSVAGTAPSMSAVGSDTNIDLTLTPKGTGNVRFGTYTADMTLVVQGYITIKDSGGTVRKLAVIA